MKKVYILIYIWRGITTEPEIYYRKKDALKRENELKMKMNPDYDEVAFYKKLV